MLELRPMQTVLGHLSSMISRGGACSGRIHDELCPAAAGILALDCPHLPLFVGRVTAKDIMLCFLAGGGQASSPHKICRLQKFLSRKLTVFRLVGVQQAEARISCK